MTIGVHQFHGMAAFGDAIGNHMQSLQRLLRKAGYESEIFCERSTLDFEGRARPFADYERFSAPDAILLLHFSIAYPAEVLRWLEQLPDRKILIYHNVTPPHYFAGVNDTYFEETQAALEQLDVLSKLIREGWGVSAFNCRELERRGWTTTRVLPIAFDPEIYRSSPSSHVSSRWGGKDTVNILFVGRLSPNKRFEDLILTFYYLKRRARPDARLLLVGSYAGMERYLNFLQALVQRLGLSDVEFVGHVSQAELTAYYQVADVFLSHSEHEGFGVPLLECMAFNVPIVAYRAAAVPETLGGAGILFSSKDHARIAELINIVLSDPDLRARVLAKQQKRLQDFSFDRIGATLRQWLAAQEQQKR